MRVPRSRLLSALASVLMVIGVMTATSSTAHAEDAHGTISGTVVGESGLPVAGVQVDVLTFNDPRYPGFPYSQNEPAVYTDSTGAYSISAPVGDNVLRFSKEGLSSFYYGGGNDHLTALRIPTAANQIIPGVNVVIRRPQLVMDSPYGRIDDPFFIKVPRASLNQRLSITSGRWTADGRVIPPNELTFTYQWTRGDSNRTLGAPIPGATGPTFMSSTVDLKKYLGVIVTASHPQFRGGSVSTVLASPIRRHAQITPKTATSPKKRTIRLKVRVSAEGLPYASGPVAVVCARKNVKRYVQSKTVRLKKGKATLTVKIPKLSKRDKKVYCRFSFDPPERGEVARADLPADWHSRGVPIRLRWK